VLTYYCAHTIHANTLSVIKTTFWLKYNKLLHEASTLLQHYPLPTYEGLNQPAAESLKSHNLLNILTHFVHCQASSTIWIRSIQIHNAKVPWDPKLLSHTLSTVNISKVYSKFKTCDINFANYIQGCKEKLSSQHQDQHISKTIPNITPNQMNYMTAIIPLWVIKMNHVITAPI
jgi:hypothetical protein